MVPEKDNLIRFLLIKYKHGAARYIKDLDFEGPKYTISESGIPVYELPKKSSGEHEDRITKLMKATESMMETITVANDNMSMSVQTLTKVMALVLQRMPELNKLDPLKDVELPGITLTEQE